MFYFLLCLILSICIQTIMNASMVVEPKGANIQIIHNSADTSLRFIDIYLNEEKIISEFEFRKATPFFSIDSDTLLKLDIVRSPSNSSLDKLQTFSFVIEKGNNATLLIQGIKDSLKYLPNPNGKSIALSLDILYNISLLPTNFDETPVRIISGCTDLVETNLIAKDIAPLLVNMSLRSSTMNDIIMPSTNYTFILLEPNTRKMIKEFTVNLTDFGGQSMVLFFSGFNNPQKNENGKPLGIFGAKHDGTIIDFQKLTSITEINKPSQNIAFILSQTEFMTELFKQEWEIFMVYNFLGELIYTITTKNDDNNNTVNAISPGLYFIITKYHSSEQNLFKVFITE